MGARTNGVRLFGVVLTMAACLLAMPSFAAAEEAAAEPPPAAPADGGAADEPTVAGETPPATPPPAPNTPPATPPPTATPPPAASSGDKTDVDRGGRVRPRTGKKIRICHRTSSATNPYVLINVDVAGLNGHGPHRGDIIPAPDFGCPGRDDDCDEHGLPCASIPMLPSPLWGLFAIVGGVAGGAALTRRGKK